MKAIILSASTGGGHMSAANAINDYLSAQGDIVYTVDTLEYISPILNKTITEIYEFIATKNPALWKMMYNSSNKKSINKLVGIINSLISRKLMPLLGNFDPDIIVTTHPFATKMISVLKERGKINVPLVCILTDYAPHRTWINSRIDAYIVANEDMITQMIDMDVPSGKIYPFGIPIDDAFFDKLDKEKTLNEIGMSAKIPTILIMAGSCGLANIGKIYRELQNIDIDFQIIVITGKNQKLYDKMQALASGIKSTAHPKLLYKISGKIPQFKHLKIISKIKNPHNITVTKKTKIIKYTSHVNKYMKISDLIFTKPGGLTVSEALACDLPMALYDAIPGQEEENANFLVGNNMAVKLDSSHSVSSAVKDLLLNPQKLRSLKHSCKNFDKSKSLINTYTLLKNLQSQK